MTRCFRILLGLALVAQGLAAQGGPAAPAQTVTRRDLADAYLVVDRVAAARGVPAAQRARWNEDFDRTTLAFFGGDFAKVLRDMHDLTARMLADSAPQSPTRQLLAFRLRSAPRVLTPADSVVHVDLTLMYGDAARSARALRVRIVGADGRELAQRRLEIPAEAAAGQRFAVNIPRRDLPATNTSLEVVASLDGAATDLRTPLFVMDQRADDIRAALDAERHAARGATDPQVQASVQARLALLRDVPDEGNTAQFLANPVALAAALQDEIAAVAAGRDPYRRTGDIWRVMQVAGVNVPFRLYIPPQARANARLPLVVALHGAGADENMFFEGYGDGRLRTLADSLGFIAVAPLTTEFARDPAALDTLLAVVARANPFDRERVYLLGHSLGAAVSLRVAAQRPDAVAAAALIAGTGNLPESAQLPPSLFLAAERDLVIPAVRVRATYDALRARGLAVEYYEAAGWGHTLVVGPELERAVTFLLRH